VEERVRKYDGSKYYEINMLGLKRKMPIVKISDNLWIASDAELVLGDVEFLSRVGKELACRVAKYKPEVVVVPEAKAIVLAYEIAKNLNHKEYVVARKEVKGYMRKYVSEEVNSITTSKKQLLVLDEIGISKVHGRRVCLVDDVISTGSTISALERLVQKANGIIVCKAAIWVEGPWYTANDIIYLDILPIFVG